MLTTSLDGLWVLQILTGIESLCPELGLRPHMPSVETKSMALQHPVAAELIEQGVIDEHGTVDTAVVEWLTVVSKRDVALLMQVQTPTRNPAGVVLCRFAQWWVAVERADTAVRISPAGVATVEGSASAIVVGQLERFFGTCAPAKLRPVTLDVAEMLSSVTDQASQMRFLTQQKLEPDQIHMLTLASDTTRSAQASIVALQTGVESGLPNRVHIEDSVVSIIDTEEGRLLAEHVPSNGKKWMIISPGTAGNIAAGVNKMLRRLPAEDGWHSYRKVV